MKVFCQFDEFLVVSMDYAIDNGNHISSNMNFSTFYSCSKRIGHIMHTAKLLSTLKRCGIDSEVRSKRISYTVGNSASALSKEKR